MSTIQPVLPTLTINRSFIRAFIAADKPCCALGMVEVQNRQCGLLALRPDVTIPPDASAGGFDFGHSLYGNSTFEVIHFGFEFSGLQPYNVLVNPNNPIARAVLQTMIESGDYFFFAVDEDSGSVTAFRTDIEQDILTNLTADWERIQRSTTTDSQYCQALLHFAENPYPQGTLLNWVCQDNLNYLDLTQDRLDLPPA